MEEVRLLEGHVAADPGGGADVEVGLVVRHRAGADGRGVEVRRAQDHLGRGGDAQLLGRGRLHRPQDVHRRLQLGQLLPLDPGQAQEQRVVVDAVDVPVVRDPVEGDGVVGGGEAAGEAQVQVVLGLQEFVGLPVDVGLRVLQVEDVGDGVLARAGGDAPGASDPVPELVHPVALQGDGPAGDAPHVGRAPGVHPDDGVHQRAPASVHGHGAGPLAGAGHCGDLVPLLGVAGQEAAGGRYDGLPPLRRVLLRAAIGQEDEPRLLELAVQNAAPGIGQGHLGAGCAQIHGQDACGFVHGGVLCG